VVTILARPSKDAVLIVIKLSQREAAKQKRRGAKIAREEAKKLEKRMN